MLTVISKASRAGVTNAGGSLLVVQVKFGLEGAQHYHRTIVLYPAGIYSRPIRECGEFGKIGLI
jgi:hypothetical protein